MNSTLPTPRTLDPEDAPALNWGVLGPGGIARTFAESLAVGTTARVVAAGSRSRDRAKAFAGEFGGRPHGSYEELVNDETVEAVYVASPHSEHREHALMAIAAGKHVLVEKSFTRNADEAREVLAAADKAGVFIMEAMWSRFLPHYDVVRQAVASGLLGDLQTINADHGQLLFPDGPQRLADPNLAGGALLDLGVYPVHFAAMLLPHISTLTASGRLTPDGVDECESITMLGDDVMATATTTMAAQTANTAVVAGTKARLEIEGWFYMPSTVRLISSDDELLDTYTSPVTSHALQFEAAEAARCIKAGKRESELLPHAETVRVMKLMDDVRRQLGVVYPGE